MLVLAGPGSGKTHLLVERIRIMIEDNHIPPDSILVITFSKKAARQMQARFQRRVEGKSYPVTFGTFHAVFYHMLQEFDPNIKRLITEEEQTEFARTLMDKYGFFDEDIEPDEMIGMISSYRNLSDGFFNRDDRGMGFDEDKRERFIQLAEGYDSLCRKSGVIDFDDMIILCRRMFQKHEMFLRKCQQRYRYFLVDEFQDINPGQYDVLRLLAGDSMNVFAVGDDDQSIYAFRGSDPKLMKKFIKQFRGCRQVTLTMNYRCCQNVIGAADAVIRHNIDRFDRPMQRNLPSKNGGTVEIIHSESTDVQAQFLCDMIDRLVNEQGCSASDIAVLYRSEHCAKRFVDVAMQRNISLAVTGDHASKPKAEKIHEAYMRAHNGTAGRSDFFLIMNNPERGLSRESLCDTSGDYFADMRAYYRNDEDKLRAVDDLEKTVRSYGTGYVYERPPEPRERINVMTAHASKGLEFGYVFIIGLQEGLFPHRRNMEYNAEEERRLMYVAMTRARECLYLCAVSTEHGKRPSRFVAEACRQKQYIHDTLRLQR